MIECPLQYPASSLEFGCIEHDDVPDLMVRMTFDIKAGTMDFSSFGRCTIVGEGPAAGQPPRFKTDSGYKVCLFDQTAPPGQLTDSGKSQRPGAFYLDLSDNAAPLDELTKQSQFTMFNPPVTLVLDTRFLATADREKAFNQVTQIFDYYRKFTPVPSIIQVESP